MAYESKYTLTLRWQHPEDASDPPKSHWECLDEAGFTRALQLASEGYHEGELLEELGGVMWRGWWDLSLTHPEED
jgi:hypothetical protein